VALWHSGIVNRWQAWDSEPLAGIMPFWVWDESAVNAEWMTLPLPAETPAGEYLVLMGVYRADTGERATLAELQDFGSRRYWLATLTVK